MFFEMSGFPSLLIYAIAVLAIILPIIAIISILRNDSLGTNKIAWILSVIFLPLLGTLLYFAFGASSRLKTS